MGIGGDHSVTLAELRAVAAVHGPLGLVHFDSHTDPWDTYNGQPYIHGTMFRRAIEEGILDPARTLQAGMRGPLYGADDEASPGDLGVEMIPWHELRELGPRALRPSSARPARRRARCSSRSTSTSSTPRTAPAPARRRSAARPASRPSRSCAPDRPAFVGFDVVEVAPAYDGPGQITALFAATVAWEIVCLYALRRRDG